MLATLAKTVPVIITSLPHPDALATTVAEIIEDGRNGILVPEATADALTWAAKGMLGDRELRERLSLAARETVASRYSADRMIDDTARIFEELISGGAGGE